LAHVVGSCAFTEYATKFGIDIFDINRTFASATLVSFAIMIAKSHESLGYGTSAISRFEPPRLPLYAAQFSETLGEFNGPDGRRFVLSDFASTLRSFIRAAIHVSEEMEIPKVLSELWLPTVNDDGHTSHIVAYHLHDFLSEHGFQVGVDELNDFVFSGEVPPPVAAAIGQLPPHFGASVARLFERYSTPNEFLSMFSDQVGQLGLAMLDLSWTDPNVGDLRFESCPKNDTRYILQEWHHLSRAYEETSGVMFQPPKHVDHVGSIHQISRVSGDGRSFKVRTYYDADELVRNTLCCFGSSAVFSLPFRHLYRGRIKQDSYVNSFLSEYF